MKKLSKKSLGIAAAIGSTMLPISCSKEEFSESIPNDNIYTIKKSSEFINGYVAVPLFQSNIDWEYIHFLDDLCLNIINNPEIAREFSNSPSEYLHRFGYYNTTINTNDVFFNLILALGDSEVLDAMESGELTKFVKVLDKNGYLNKISNCPLNIHISESDSAILKQLDNYLKNDGVTETSYYVGNSNIEEQGLVAIFLVYAVAVCVSQAAVAYNALAAVNAETYTNVHHKVNAWVRINVKTKGQGDVNMNNEILMQYIESNPVINIWTLKGRYPSDIYYVANSAIQQELDSMLDWIQEKNPHVYDVYSREKLAQLFVINMEPDMNRI